jgi:hypothetical protein
MGAQTFMSRAVGKTAREAFDAAVAEAQYDYGHRGYTGTIAEKDSFRMIDVPDGESPSEFACRLMDEDDERIRDKWGPAGCVEVERDDKTERKEFLFFGWASS